MLNLFLADLYKMRKSAAMKILLGISTACSLAMVIIAYLIAKGNLGNHMGGIGFLFSDGSAVNLLAAVVAGVFICADFDNKSIHDEIAAGYSRGQILLSKSASFSVALAAIILPYAVVTGISLGTGCKFYIGPAQIGFLHLLTAEAGKALNASEIGRLLVIMLVLFLVYIGQSAICILLSFAVKKPVVVVAVNYALAILIGQLQSIKGSSKIFDHFFAFTPFSGSYYIMALNTQTGTIVKAIIVSLLFAAAVLAITFCAFRKSEIK